MTIWVCATRANGNELVTDDKALALAWLEAEPNGWVEKWVDGARIACYENKS